ncbi:MAG: DUF2007 domain-containing protein [Lentimicrobium sp.]|jgi:hypothetical protein|nr:DUF2007 domain-containing protein [Lentimicrobium sp.]MDD2527986.1 DUF2007 domain-containing protein [Lentimicrobiaceae bacterium]MDD4597206.1 DUF2007 domain-containing protein [Lentimicrobiaceae bacterium]MDY0025657.1 DUF2007 domain-containing protein [Lentimicrobium sp.]HAH58135.1 hypothetical protein [Bacteroidales bacterium]
MEGWVKIFASGQLHECELVKGMLADNNITAIIVNKQDSVYLFGEIELYVSVEDAFEANHLINLLHRE